MRIGNREQGIGNRGQGIGNTRRQEAEEKAADFEKRKVCATGKQQLVKLPNCKKIGFAPASFLFSGISKIGFGFKLAFIGFGVQIGSSSLLPRPAIPPRVENRLIG